MTTRSAYRLPGMDCASEEALVRARLRSCEGVGEVLVDLGERVVVVDHDGPAPDDALHGLGLGSQRLADVPRLGPAPSLPRQRRALVAALALNLVGFLVEGVLGLRYGSAAVTADGLDMGADVLGYVLALGVLGAGVARERLAARGMGALMGALAVGGIVEVVRRVVVDTPAPEATPMAWLAVAGLAINLAVMVVMARVRGGGGAAVSAGWIMASTDVQANVAVLGAAGLVAVTGLAVPDLLVGAVVFGVVGRGALRLWRAGR